MRKRTLLLALLFSASPPSADAQNKAIVQQQQAIARHQQQLMQQQQKAIEAQQRAMVQQHQQMLKAQQQMMAQQQKAAQAQMHQHQQQLKAQSAQVGAGTAPHHSTTAASNPNGQTNATGTVAKAHNPAGASRAHAAARHHNPVYVVNRAHGLLAWPHSSTLAYRQLMQLKHQLDVIARNSTPTTSQTLALKNSLLNVVHNSPRPPSAHVLQLSNDLTAALASRNTPAVDTKDLALSLRAMMNAYHLTPAEAQQSLATSQNVLGNAGITPAHVGTVSGDLQYLVSEVVASAP